MGQEQVTGTHFVDKHVGKRLRERRTLLGFTQKDLAKKLDITTQQVQKYESAANRVSASRLYDMTVVIGAPISYFFEGLPTDTNHSDRDDHGKVAVEGDGKTTDFNRDVLSLAKAYANINNQQLRKTIRQLVESLSGAT